MLAHRPSRLDARLDPAFPVGFPTSRSGRRGSPLMSIGTWWSVRFGNVPAPDPWPFFSACGLLVRPHPSRIDQPILIVAIGCQRLEHPFPDPGVVPAAEAAVDAPPVALAPGKVAPVRSRAQHPAPLITTLRLSAAVWPGSHVLPARSLPARSPRSPHCRSFGSYRFARLHRRRAKRRPLNHTPRAAWILNVDRSRAMSAERISKSAAALPGG